MIQGEAWSILIDRLDIFLTAIENKKYAVIKYHYDVISTIDLNVKFN